LAWHYVVDFVAAEILKNPQISTDFNRAGHNLANLKLLIIGQLVKLCFLPWAQEVSSSNLDAPTIPPIGPKDKKPRIPQVYRNIKIWQIRDNYPSASCFFSRIFAVQSRAEGSAEPSANGAAVHELTGIWLRPAAAPRNPWRFLPDFLFDCRPLARQSYL
jgi:hypothetical protein